MGAWPSLYSVRPIDSGEPLLLAITATAARRRASEAYGIPPEHLIVSEVPLTDPIKVTRIPRGPLPGSAPAPALVSPTAEPVAPARRGDPETAQKAAAAARRLGDNRRTEILRWIVGEVGRHWEGTPLQGREGVTESELTRDFGGVPGGNSKRLGELVGGAWLYARGERPSVTTGSPQRVLFPTSGALAWVAENPAPRQKGGPNA